MLKNFLTENVTMIINPSPSKVAHDNWSHSSGYCVGVDTTPCETLQAMSEEQQLACFSSAISTYMFIYSRRTEGSVEKKKGPGKPKRSTASLCAPSPRGTAQHNFVLTSYYNARSL